MDWYKLYSYDLNTCEKIEEFDFTNSGLDLIPFGGVLQFHPDGHLYILGSSKHLYRYHPLRKEVNQIIVLNTSRQSNQIAVSEEGRIILSHNSNDIDSSITEIYDLDLRQNEVIQIFDKRDVPLYDSQGDPVSNPKYVGGILKDGFFLMPTLISDSTNWGMWNPETGELKALPVRPEENTGFMAASISSPPCGDFSVYAHVIKKIDQWNTEFWISLGGYDFK